MDTYGYVLHVGRAAYEFSELRERIEKVALDQFPSKADEEGFQMNGDPTLRWGDWITYDEEGYTHLATPDEGTHRMLVVESPVQIKDI